MKTLKYLAICAAAFTFAACNVEEPAVPETAQKNLVTVHFGAEIVEPATKATLTPGEDVFKADWEVGDEISLWYHNDVDEDVVTATWDGTSFVAVIPEYEGDWKYGAFYPKIGDYDFSKLTQVGDAYDSMADLMYSEEVDTEGAAAGKDAEGNPIVIPFYRDRAIAYFHFTSNLDEDVVSATLSAGKACTLAFSAMSIHEDPDWGIVVDYDDSVNEINLTTTGQNAKDFTLWFPVESDHSISDMTLTVTTETKTMTLARTGDITYTAGMVYTTEMEIADEKWEDAEEEEVTVSVTINDIVADNGYTVSAGTEIGDIVTSIQLDENLIMSTDGSANSGSFWTTNSTIDWRLYQTTSANLKFTVPEGYLIKSVKVTYNNNNNGSLYDKGVAMASNTIDENINFPSVEYTVASTNKDKTNGQVRVTAVEVVYYKGEVKAVPVTGVEIGLDAFNLKAGATEELVPEIMPSNATNQDVIWSSSDETVATVVNGVVTGVAAGEADITVTTVDGGFTSSCTVYVTAAPVFASLEELVAAGEPTTGGYFVTVTLTDVKINSIYMSGSYRNGIYVAAGGKDVQIYCRNVPDEWVAGGKVSGTLENCTWKKYNTTWELCPESWDELEYAEPEAVVPVGEVATFEFNNANAIKALGIALPATSSGTSLDPDTDYVIDDVTMNITHGGTDTRIWNTGSAYDLRVYKSGGSITFTVPDGMKITSIVLTGSATSVFDVDSGKLLSGTWTAPEAGATSVTFSATGSGRINTVKVCYE